MVTAVIEASDDPEALTRTLAVLVPGAIEGIVREVIVIDPLADPQTAHVSDCAGCVLLTRGQAATGLRGARGTWLLILEPGARLSPGWTEAVSNHMATSARAARFEPAGVTLRQRLTRLFVRTRPLARGLLVRKEAALSLFSGDDGLAALVPHAPLARIGAVIYEPRCRR